VDADDDETVDNNWYATNNGLGSLDVCRSSGRCVRGALEESAELLAKGKERELLTVFIGLCKELNERNKAMCWGCANSK
jgi:hypothetical protein